MRLRAFCRSGPAARSGPWSWPSTLCLQRGEFVEVRCRTRRATSSGWRCRRSRRRPASRTPRRRGAQCTSTESVHGAIWTWRRIPHRRGPPHGRDRPSARRIGECSPSAAARYRARSSPARTDVAVLGDLADVGVDESHARRLGGLQQRRVQHRPAHTEARSRAERRVDPSVAVQVADAAQRLALAGSRRGAPGVRGCAASSLRRTPCREPRGGVRRRRPRVPPCAPYSAVARPAGPPPPTSRSITSGSRARVFSTLIRVRSSTALSTVKTTAVIHAVCTSGSAMPSTTTAT